MQLRRLPPGLLVAGLTLIGAAIRIRLAGQSLFADEISSYSVAAHHGLADVVSTVHSDQEITPPLYFVAAWLAARIDLTPELLRVPSLLAGVASVPLTYLLGLRTAGRPAGLLAAAFAALSPFMLFYSSEARGYALAVALVLGSTLAMLEAVESGRARWWVVYAVCSCAAVYTHYTTVFALGAQLVWLLATQPAARRPALLANVAAAIAYLPWFSGLRADFRSPTTDILDRLDIVNAHTIRVSLEHWALGYPFPLPTTGLEDIPGVLSLVLLGLAIALSALGIGLALRGRALRLPGRVDRLLLLVALAIGVPVGLTVVSAIGTNLVSVRHLATAWPAFSVLLAAFLLTPEWRVRAGVAALAVVSFALGAGKMLESRFQRPDYEAAAGFVDRHATPRDVVIDGTNFSPAPVTALDAALDRRQRVFYPGRYRVQFDPFRILSAPAPPDRVTRRAVAAARGGRVFVVASETLVVPGGPLQNPLTRQVTGALPARYRRVQVSRYAGILRLAVLVYARRPSGRG